MIKLISDTSDRSIRMIREFVKQEFLESSNVELILKRINIVESIKITIDQYRDSESFINKKFNFTSTKYEIYVEIDEYKFIQVLNNLISNSIKFTHDGGHISVHIEEKPEEVIIIIEDDGLGIPENRQKGLFEKIYQSQKTRT